MPLLVLIIQTLLFTAGCKQTTEPKLDAELTLELEDVSCTEAWIKLTTNNIQLPATINLLKNNSISQVYVLSTQDSLLYIDSLLPNQTYKFKVVLNATNNPQPTTNELTVTTMDTTSHNFTWQTFTFGEPGAGSSTLYDVAIIDENNIWAVGEIYLLDSLGNPDPNAYNAVHWNGQQWELKRIPIYLPSGYPFYPVIKSVFAFNSNDIWFEAGIHWDGNSFKQIPFNIQWSGNVNKLWGSSSEDLFAVGNNGNIAHWDGRKWTKIESGTDLRINDIWGDYNEKTGKTEILAIAAEINVNRGSKVLRIEGNSVIEESNNGLSWDVGGIWFKSGRRYYVAGAGIHQKHYLSDSVWKRYNPGIATNYVGYGIRGRNINDIIAVGSFLEIAHFNGISWHNYLREIYSTVGALGRIALTANLTAAVGSNGSQAIIVLGERN